MRWIRSMLIGVLMIAGLGLSPAHAVRMETRQYVLAPGPVVCTTLLTVNGKEVHPPSPGGACFDRKAGESKISVTVTDAALNPIGFTVSFDNANGDNVGTPTLGCRSRSNIAIPASAARVWIHLSVGVTITLDDIGPGITPGPSGCGGTNGILGSQGDIRATFS